MDKSRSQLADRKLHKSFDLRSIARSRECVRETLVLLRMKSKHCLSRSS